MSESPSAVGGIAKSVPARRESHEVDIFLLLPTLNQPRDSGNVPHVAIVSVGNGKADTLPPQPSSNKSLYVWRYAVVAKRKEKSGCKKGAHNIH